MHDPRGLPGTGEVTLIIVASKTAAEQPAL